MIPFVLLARKNQILLPKPKESVFIYSYQDKENYGYGYAYSDREEESFRINKGKGREYVAETTTSLHLRIVGPTDSSMQLSGRSFLCEVWTKTLVRPTS